MTLVCATSHMGVPVVFGDMLLSTNSETHRPIPTNDHLDAVDFRSKEYKVFGITQKCFIVRNNFALALADDVMSAYATIRVLQESLSAEPTISEIKIILERDFELEGSASFVLVGAVVEKGSSICMKWDGITGELSTDNMFVEGSGADTFQKRFVEYDASLMFRLRNPDFSEQVPRLESVRAWCFEAIGQFLAEEIMYGESLKEHFGGGYDALFYDETSFVRPSTITQFYQRYILGARGKNISIETTACTFLATSFWQSYQDGWTAERIDLDPEHLKVLGTKIRMNIESRRMAKVNSSRGLELKNTSSKNLQFALFHRSVSAGDTVFAAHSTCYKLPNTDVSIKRTSQYVQLKLSKEFHLRGFSEALRIMEHPQMKKEILAKIF